MAQHPAIGGDIKVKPAQIAAMRPGLGDAHAPRHDGMRPGGIGQAIGQQRVRMPAQNHIHAGQALRQPPIGVEAQMAEQHHGAWAAATGLPDRPLGGLGGVGEADIGAGGGNIRGIRRGQPHHGQAGTTQGEFHPRAHPAGQCGRAAGIHIGRE